LEGKVATGLLYELTPKPQEDVEKLRRFLADKFYASSQDGEEAVQPPLPRLVDHATTPVGLGPVCETAA
jgi:hypothetical protein